MVNARRATSMVALVAAMPRRALATMSSVSLAALESKAAAVRAKLCLPPHAEEALAFDSAFARADGSSRGWCNWLVPGRLMVGRYPHLDPIAQAPKAGSRAFGGGPSEADVAAHLERVVCGAGVRCFVSLQEELPPQQLAERWPDDGRVYLASGAGRERFPGPFVRYFSAASEARARCAPAPLSGPPPLSFVHFGIRDLSLPASRGEAHGLLHALLCELEGEGGGALYVHCWGGRGRAGLIGGALLALLQPELSAAQLLAAVQGGYDTRAGAKAQQGSLARSPQTEEQREWLAQFARECEQLRLGGSARPSD